ncbi:MAG: hypothetical protein LH631_06860 [Alkalinema sp. CAN_BIN05]|jgi:hypothetical protein|nr:hypothetical protein [Alkalinema sp. CAN_BIN05]
MTELKLISKQSASIQPLVKNAIDSFVRSAEEGIQKTQQNLITFETKYGMITSEFIQRYENDELDETLEFGEWIGEYRMLQGLIEDADQLRGIEFAA